MLYSVTWGTARLTHSHEPSFFRCYAAFLGLFWLTAPLAWLYAIPYERFLPPLVRFATRDNVRKQLETIGEAAREQLQAVAKVGSLERRTRAAAVLAVLDAEAQKILLVRDLEFAHWMKRYETDQTRFQWDEKARRYTIGGR